MPATASTDLLAVELFSSLQGEGLWIGSRQIFFRLATCNLNCEYCDTDFSVQEHCRLETAPGSGEFQAVANPVAMQPVLELLDRWLELEPNLHQALNLTGGEPLCQGETLLMWLPELRKRLPLHLETNGTLPEQLEPVLPWLDFISMDIKLASVTGQPTLWDEHRRFLQESGHIQTQVKCVVGQQSLREEIEAVADLLAEVAPQAPLILQPVTKEGRPTLSGRELMQLQLAASRIHQQVRIIPQVHPILAVL